MKILKSLFWLEKVVNISPQYTKRSIVSICFLRKVDFVKKNSLENHDFRFLRIQQSFIVISKILNHDYLLKILTKLSFLRKHNPQNIAILHFLVYFGLILKKNSGKKKLFQIFFCFPNCMLCQFPWFYKTPRQIVNIFSLN